MGSTAVTVPEATKVEKIRFQAGFHLLGTYGYFVLVARSQCDSAPVDREATEIYLDFFEKLDARVEEIRKAPDGITPGRLLDAIEATYAAAKRRRHLDETLNAHFPTVEYRGGFYTFSVRTLTGVVVRMHFYGGSSSIHFIIAEGDSRLLESMKRDHRVSDAMHQWRNVT